MWGGGSHPAADCRSKSGKMSKRMSKGGKCGKSGKAGSSKGGKLWFPSDMPAWVPSWGASGEPMPMWMPMPQTNNGSGRPWRKADMNSTVNNEDI